jgi:hypothetical protein
VEQGEKAKKGKRIEPQYIKEPIPDKSRRCATSRISKN